MSLNNPEDTLRIERKLDLVDRSLREVNHTVTTLYTRLENWPEISKQVADHEVRLTGMESLEVKKYDDRLQHLENAVSNFKGWLAGATAVAVIVGSTIAYFLSTIIAALPSL